MRALLLLVATGCSNHAAGVPPDASPTAVQLTCESGFATFPLLEKGCAAATDCFIALHQTNCCGTTVAFGLNKIAERAFTAAEVECANAAWGCACRADPTLAEDGRTLVDGTIQVRCASGLCETYVP